MDQERNQMSDPWTIVSATGARIDLERGSERKELRRPKNMSIQEFNQYGAGVTIDDATIATQFDAGQSGR
jgi:hypothetical protein